MENAERSSGITDPKKALIKYFKKLKPNDTPPNISETYDQIYFKTFGVQYNTVKTNIEKIKDKIEKDDYKRRHLFVNNIKILEGVLNPFQTGDYHTLLKAKPGKLYIVLNFWVRTRETRNWVSGYKKTKLITLRSNGDICIPIHGEILHSFRLEYLKIKNRKIKIFKESKPEQNTKPVQRLQSLRDLEESAGRITDNLVNSNVVRLTPIIESKLVLPLEAELNS